MANPGDWIDFAELCERVPGKSPCTLRRYYKARLISFRQAVRRGRVEFNWRTVERELAALETAGVNAHVAPLAALPPAGTPDLQRDFAELKTLVRAMAKKMGVAVDDPDLFAGEQRRVS